MDFFRAISKLRFVAIIAVISSFVGSSLMFVVGGLKVYKGCYYFLTGAQPERAPAHSTPGDLATIQIVASLDSFLIALALLYFGYGIYALVIDPESPGRSKAPAWLVPKGIRDLKETLALVIIVILFVLFLDELWIHLNDLTWEILVLPASIALLALAVKLMGFAGSKRP
ncbi:YqhA family protein [bacterium]|nr:YqhA family protein [bacterium]